LKSRFITLIISALFVLGCQNSVPFNSEKWKECDQSFDCILGNTRLQMVNDLLKSEILLYKKRSEIDHLLGKSRMGYFSSSNIQNYKVKEEYFYLNIDPCITYLEITFDKNGISQSVELKKQQT
jgi:hypothetical protein